MPAISTSVVGANGGDVQIRAALVSLLIVGGIAACASSSQKPNPACERLTGISNRLANAQRDLYTRGSAALPQLVGELQSLQAGAPTDVRQSLAKLVTAFQRAQQALAHPGSKNAHKELARMASVVSTDGKNVSDYATAQCD
jgi:hypothetical protein